MPRDNCVYNDDTAGDIFGDDDAVCDNDGRDMVTFCIQYKSSKTTYDLGTG